MQQDAWNHGDIDRFMNGYAHSSHTVFVSEDTIRRGWQTVRDRYREKYSDRGEDGGPDLFRSRDHAAMARFGCGAWTLEITAGQGSAARAIYAHLQTLAGRVADCARSHIGGCAAAVIRKELQKLQGDRGSAQVTQRFPLCNFEMVVTLLTSPATSHGCYRIRHY
jgi:hypothetical protein